MEASLSNTVSCVFCAQWFGRCATIAQSQKQQDAFADYVKRYARGSQGEPLLASTDTAASETPPTQEHEAACESSPGPDERELSPSGADEGQAAWDDDEDDDDAEMVGLLSDSDDDA